MLIVQGALALLTFEKRPGAINPRPCSVGPCVAKGSGNLHRKGYHRVIMSVLRGA